MESEVFLDLYNFFRRYYNNGDFLSLRRYKEGVYAIPYEGEEVKLYWVNHDQCIFHISGTQYQLLTDKQIETLRRCERIGRPTCGEEFIALLENKLQRPLLSLKRCLKFRAKTENK